MVKMRNGQEVFNVLECVKHLRQAGFTQEQAEAQAREIEKAKNDLESNLATKRDIVDLKRDIEKLRGDTKREIKALEERIGFKMVITSGSFAFLILGALVTLAKLGLLTPAK